MHIATQMLIFLGMWLAKSPKTNPTPSKVEGAEA